MFTKVLKISLLSLAVSAAGANAAQVAGTVNSKGNVEIVRSGVSQSLNNSSAAYMINDQLVTSKKAAASVFLKGQKPLLNISPETSVSVSQSSPLGVALESGTVSAIFKPAQTLSINTPNSFVSAKAVSAGELVVISEGGKLAVAAKSGSFSLTDATGITRTVSAADKKALVIGQGKSEMIDVNALVTFFGAASPAYVAGVIAALAAVGIVATAVVSETTNDDEAASPSFTITPN